MSQEVKELQDACQKLIEMVNECNKSIDELKAENDFLTDTIVKQKMGKYSEERRNLLEKIASVEKQITLTKDESEKVKTEYSEKVKEVSSILKDIKSKQADLNKYIEDEANALIKDKAEELKQKSEADVKKLKKEKDLLSFFSIISAVIGIAGIALYYFKA